MKKILILVGLVIFCFVSYGQIIEKITYENKVNLRPIVDRTKQSTAEDWNEVKAKFNSLVDYNEHFGRKIKELDGRDTTGIYHINRQLLDSISQEDTTNWNKYLIETDTSGILDKDNFFWSANKKYELITPHIGGGTGDNVYMTNVNSDIPGYKKTSYTNDAGITSFSAIASADTVLVQQFLFDGQLSTSILDAGEWVVETYCNVSSIAGVSKFKYEFFVYDDADSTIFSFYSDEINNTAFQYNEYTSFQSAFNLGKSTYRLGVRVYFLTTLAAPITGTFRVGDGETSYINTPIALRHVRIRNPNEDPNVQHMTADDQNAINQYKKDSASYLTSEVDGSINNEIQDLSRAGNTLSLSGDGTTVDLSDLVNPDLSGYRQKSDHDSLSALDEKSYNSLTDKPASLPASDVYPWAKAATKPTYTYSEVGLSNVDNTSDANKPISTATQTALNAKLAISDTTNKWQPKGTYLTSYTETDPTVSALVKSIDAADTTWWGRAETDPTISAWAKAATKPTYTYSEVGAQPAGSYLTSEVDGSTTNEIQDLSRAGNTLSLSGDGTTVDLSDLVNPDLSGYRQKSDHDSLSALDEKSYNSLTDKPNLALYQLNSDTLTFDATLSDLADSSAAIRALANTKAVVSGTTGYLSKITGTNTLENSSIYESGGLVGVATTTPRVLFDVPYSSIIGPTDIRTDGGLIINNRGTGDRYAFIDFKGDDFYNSPFRIIRYNTGQNAVTQQLHRGTGSFELKTMDAGQLRLYTKNTIAVTIDTLQNAGFGTLTPNARVHSRSTGTQARLGYDVNRYTDLSTGSTGNLTIDPTGDTVKVVGAVNSTGGFFKNGVEITGGGGGGGISNIGITVPTGLTVTPTSLTSNGTFTFGLQSGYSIPTTANQTNWSTAYTNRITSASGTTPLALSISNNTLSGSLSWTLTNINNATPSVGYLYYNGSTYSYQAATTTYTLPTATAYVLGGVKVNGNGIDIDAGGTLWQNDSKLTTRTPILTDEIAFYDNSATAQGKMTLSTLGSLIGGSGGSRVYPGAGIPVSTGSAWGTSKTAPSGEIVGTTDSQALTNKSINGVTLSTGAGTTNFLAGDGTYKAVSGTSQWTADTYGITYTNNVGIGVASSNIMKLDVGGYARATMFEGQNTSASLPGVWGNNPNYFGIVGYTGNSIYAGIFGSAASGTNGKGVVGSADGSGTGVHGLSPTGYGGVFEGLGCKATKFYVSSLNTAPASSTATGTTGEIRFTADYIYVCVATNTWKRTQISTW